MVIATNKNISTMDSIKGFYVMQRGWMEHHLFKNEPFTEREAWIWFIEKAAFQSHKLRYKNKIFLIERGQIPTSYRKLSDTFGWGVNRVRGLLATLEREGMTSSKTDTGFLIVTICNYNDYQIPLKNSDTVADTHSDTHSDTVADTNIIKGNKLKEFKEKKEGKIFILHLPVWLPRQDWDDWLEMRSKMRKQPTDRALQMALDELSKLQAQGHDPGKVLQQSIMNNWTGLFAVKGDFSNKPKPPKPRISWKEYENAGK